MYRKTFFTNYAFSDSQKLCSGKLSSMRVKGNLCLDKMLKKKKERGLKAI
jgi:hypothetical protein